VSESSEPRAPNWGAETGSGGRGHGIPVPAHGRGSQPTRSALRRPACGPNRPYAGQTARNPEPRTPCRGLGHLTRCPRSPCGVRGPPDRTDQPGIRARSPCPPAVQGLLPCPHRGLWAAPQSVLPPRNHISSHRSATTLALPQRNHAGLTAAQPRWPYRRATTVGSPGGTRRWWTRVRRLLGRRWWRCSWPGRGWRGCSGRRSPFRCARGRTA